LHRVRLDPNSQYSGGNVQTKRKGVWMSDRVEKMAWIRNLRNIGLVLAVWAQEAAVRLSV
jgi:hypothetical protein